MKNLAIIPARKGSKGLPDKNILPLAGKPMLAYAVEAAVESGLFDYIMVSTDSKQYADIAVEYGAKIPFLRSADNASDTASSWDVVREVLARLENMGLCFETITLLQPTSPLRTADDICAAMQLYHERNAKTVISVCEVPHPFEWSFFLNEACAMEPCFDSGLRTTRRQDIPKRYIANGAIYITDCKQLFMPGNDIYSSDCYAYIMDKQRSCDIDDKMDLLLAEATLKML